MKTSTLLYSALAFYAGYLVFRPKAEAAPATPVNANTTAIPTNIVNNTLQPNTNQAQLLNPLNIFENKPGISGL
jgi:hypothetical protein